MAQKIECLQATIYVTGIQIERVIINQRMLCSEGRLLAKHPSPLESHNPNLRDDARVPLPRLDINGDEDCSWVLSIFASQIEVGNGILGREILREEVWT